MIIPHRLLSPDALRGVIEAFVTREGTHYGAQDVPLATKVCQVHQQLDAGTAFLLGVGKELCKIPERFSRMSGRVV